jgi:hypothetical protein
MQLPVFKQAGEESRRTVIPHTIHSTFEIAPRATLEMPASRGGRPENNDMFKRLKGKVQNKSLKAKKEGGVSINGGR